MFAQSPVEGQPLNTESEPMAGHSWALVSGLGAIVFGSVTGLFMLGPMLPDMSADLSLSVPVLAQLVTFSSLSWAVGGLLVGPLSDTYGRKPVLLLGAVLAAASSFGVATADSFPVLALFRMLMGAGAGVIPPTSVALIGDTFPKEKMAAATGVFVAIPGVANLAGIPLAAILCDLAGWRASFVAVGAMILVAAAVFLLVCPRLPRSSNAAMTYWARLGLIFSQRVTWCLLVMAVNLQLVYGTTLVFLPPFMRVAYGLTASQVALPVALFAMGTIVGSLLGGRVAASPRRLSYCATILPGVAAFALGAFLLHAGVWASAALAGATMLGFRIAFVTMLTVCSDAGGQSRGTLLGVLVLGNQGGVSIGTSLGGVLVAHWGYTTIGFLQAAASLGGSLVFRFIIKEKTIQRAQEHFSRAG
jgi:DHA1 family inner membrane transport protein